MSLMEFNIKVMGLTFWKELVAFVWLMVMGILSAVLPEKRSMRMHSFVQMCLETLSLNTLERKAVSRTKESDESSL